MEKKIKAKKLRKQETDREQADTILRESEKRYRELYEGSPDGFIRVGMDGTIKEFNQAYREMLGYSEEELLKLTYTDLTPEQWHSMEADIVKEQILPKGYSGVYEKQYVRKDGTVFPVELRTYLIKGADGTSSGMWAFVRDITERKKMLEEIRRSRDELEVRVKERTAELKKAVEALAAERQRFDDVLNLLPAYVVLLTPDYHTPFANRFFRERFGESCGRRCFEYLFQRSEPCEVCDTYTVLKTMAPHEWEWTGPDGRSYYIYDFPFTDADGSTLILEMGIDITERKQSEDRFREQTNLIELAHDAIVVRDKDDRIVFWNRGAEQTYGWMRDEIAGELIHTVLKSEFPKPLREIKEELLETGYWEGELVHRIRNGGRIIVASRWALQRDSKGNPVATLEINRDITLRRQAEDRSRSASLYARSLIEASLDPLVTISAAGKVMDVNRATEQVTGVTRERLIGSDFSDYFTEPDKAKAGYQEAFSKGSVRDYPLSIRHVSGLVADVLYNATVYRNEDGEVEGVFAAARDITERKQAEERLKQSEEQLRLLSSQLITVQENERRRIAQELHDGIGQILSAVKFAIEDVIRKMGQEGGWPSQKSLEAVVPIIQNAVEEVRRVSMDLWPSILDDLGILPTITWLCREFEKIYSGIHIEVAIDLEEIDVVKPLKIVIYRVLQEALNNIAKHSGADLVRLFLGKRGAEIQLVIEDNGTGLDLDRVLSPGNLKRGLGLRSMKERIEFPGGSFKIESQRGHGTTIRASWPL